MAPFSASSLCPCRADDRAGVSWPQRPLCATVAGDSLLHGFSRADTPELPQAAREDLSAPRHSPATGRLLSGVPVSSRNPY